MKEKNTKSHIAASSTHESSNITDDNAQDNKLENDENASKADVRRSRRVKEITNATIIGKRKTNSPFDDEKKKKARSGISQSSSQPVQISSKTRATTKAKRELSAPPQDRDKNVVPEAYRLQRRSFNGRNHTLGIAPHDEKDRDNVLQVTSYVSDLFQHLYAAETISRPTMYMANQSDINSKMRAILVDWLIEVHMKFRLVPDTLYLCINIIDRYCSAVRIQRNKLQLVGVAALLVACKYEEIYPPEVRDCVYITDRAYQREEVLAMEQEILGTLHYRISVPTAYPFLLRFLTLSKASTLTRYAANYYMERTLQEHDLLRFRPSILSATSVVLALSNPNIMSKEKTSMGAVLGSIQLLLDYTGFNITDIAMCAALISRKIGEKPVTASRRQLVAVKRKYDSRRYHNVSTTIDLPHESHIPKFE